MSHHSFNNKNYMKNIEEQIVIYQTEDGSTAIDVCLENETVWLSQAQMANLFQKDRSVVARYIANVYKEGELDVETTCAKFAHVGVSITKTVPSALPTTPSWPSR